MYLHSYKSYVGPREKYPRALEHSGNQGSVISSSQFSERSRENALKLARNHHSKPKPRPGPLFSSTRMGRNNTKVTIRSIGSDPKFMTAHDLQMYILKQPSITPIAITLKHPITRQYNPDHLKVRSALKPQEPAPKPVNRIRKLALTQHPDVKAGYGLVYY